MRAIGAIARDQLADIYHRHLFVVALVVTGLWLVGLAVQLYLRLTPPAVTLSGALDTMLSLLGLFTLVPFCTAFSADLDRGTIRVVLSKPVSRAQYTLGKVLGCSAFSVALALFAGWVITMLAVIWGAQTPITMVGLLSAVLGSLMLGCYGMFLATLMPPLLAGVLALVLHAELFMGLATAARSNFWIICARIAAWVLPENFLTSTASASAVPPPIAVALQASGVVGYALLLIAATIVVRRRQDLVGSSRG